MPAAMAAGSSDSGGAAAGGDTPRVQRTAETIEPELSDARRDHGRPDRCPTRKELDSRLRCIYGKRRADTTMVAFGDSQIMQYFPVLDRIARRRGWRLVGLMRAGCPPMRVHYAYLCDTWRDRNLHRLEHIDPEVIVTTSGVAYEVVRDRRRLSRRRSGPILGWAYVGMLRSFVRDGANVAVMINTPRAPHDPVSCVRANRDRLDKCAFDRGPDPYHTYVARAARRVRGVRRIDVNQVACPDEVCPAVIDDVLVNRDRVHFTATFVRTLEDWLNARLPDAE